MRQRERWAMSLSQVGAEVSYMKSDARCAMQDQVAKN
jgi:hypothetical protein